MPRPNLFSVLMVANQPLVAHDMGSKEAGEAAIQNLDNTEWMGRAIVVNPAKKQQNKRF